MERKEKAIALFFISKQSISVYSLSTVFPWSNPFFSVTHKSRNPEFKLFESYYRHPDLIFSDACTQFAKVDVDVESYLGEDAIAIIQKTDPRMCSSASRLVQTPLAILVAACAYASRTLFF
jgi:hypothetical protein